jgi:hypothetical protein
MRVPTFLFMALASSAAAADPVMVFSFKTEKMDFGAGDIKDASSSFDHRTSNPVILGGLKFEVQRASD